jgi:hypothetical protein
LPPSCATNSLIGTRSATATPGARTSTSTAPCRSAAGSDRANPGAPHPAPVVSWASVRVSPAARTTALGTPRPMRHPCRFTRPPRC